MRVIFPGAEEVSVIMNDCYVGLKRVTSWVSCLQRGHGWRLGGLQCPWVPRVGAGRGRWAARPEGSAIPQALALPLSEEMQQTFKYFQTKQDTLKDSPVAPSSASGRI